MKIILFFLSFFYSSLAMAHQPDISSTMLADKGDGSWVLQIRAALTAFEYEVKYSNQNNEYESPEEFQALIAKLIESKMAVSINNVQIKLENAIVKLGHETSIMYTITGLEEDVTKIDISQKTFENIHKNRSALVIMKQGAKPQQFMLDVSNNNSAKLSYQEDEFVILNPSTVILNSPKNIWVYAIAAIATILLLILFWVFKKKQLNQVKSS